MPLPAAHALRKLGRDIALARRKRVALARLGGETFLIRERGSGTRSGRVDPQT